MNILGKIFKQKLDQRSFDFDEKYWKELEKKLDAHGSKGGFNHLKWFTLTAVFVAVVASFIFYLKQNNEIENENKNKIAPNEIVSVENSAKQTSDTKIVSKNLSDNKTAADKSGNILIENEVKKNTNAVQDEKIRSQKKNNTPNNIIADVAPQVKKSSSEKPVKKISENRNNELIAGNATSENLYSETITESEKNNIYREHANSETLPADMRFMLMNKILPHEILKIKNEEVQPTTFKESSHRRKNSYFIGAYSGMAYTGKILKSNNENTAEYISRRKNEESPVLTKNFGIDFGIGQNCWNMSVGLNYHQQGEMLDYKPEFYQWVKNSTSSWNVTDNSYWQQNTDSFSVWVANGNWQWVDTAIGYWNNGQYVYNTVQVQQYVVDTQYAQYYYLTDSTYVQKFDLTETVQSDSVHQLVSDASLKPGKSISKISYYEIPVLIGYEFPISRFTLILRTGFGVGMLSKVSANYLKNDISGDEEVAVSRMNKTMLNYMLRTGVAFYCTENFILNVEPFFRKNINSVFSNENFTQKYWNAGMNVGVMYRF